MSICSPSLSTRSEVSISCAPVELMQSCVEVKCATSWSYLKKAQPSSSPSPGPLRLEYEDEICSHLGPCGGNSGTDVAMLQGRRNLGLWCSSRLYVFFRWKEHKHHCQLLYYYISLSETSKNVCWNTTLCWRYSPLLLSVCGGFLFRLTFWIFIIVLSEWMILWKILSVLSFLFMFMRLQYYVSVAIFFSILNYFVTSEFCWILWPVNMVK